MSEAQLLQDLCKTFDEWKVEGFIVKKGEKSFVRRDDGTALFAPWQTKFHRSREISDEDYDNTFDFQYTQDEGF